MPRIRKPCSLSVSPILKSIFEVMDTERVSFDAMEFSSGYPRQSIYAWRQGKHSPKIDAVNDLLGLFGYELQIVRKNENP